MSAQACRWVALAFLVAIGGLAVAVLLVPDPWIAVVFLWVVAGFGIFVASQIDALVSAMTKLGI